MLLKEIVSELPVERREFLRFGMEAEARGDQQYFDTHKDKIEIDLACQAAFPGEFVSIIRGSSVNDTEILAHASTLEKCDEFESGLSDDPRQLLEVTYMPDFRKGVQIRL